MRKKHNKRLAGDEKVYIKKLHAIVEESISKEKILINELLHPDNEKPTTGQKIADKVASFGGSWKFIISFFVILVSWIVVNIILASKAFDPYPFILLNLFLSCIAAIQAPIIIMSQNRSEEKDRKRAENDYLINLKAEIQIQSLHQKIDLLLEEQIKTLFKAQDKQLAILKKIEDKLGEKS